MNQLIKIKAPYSNSTQTKNKSDFVKIGRGAPCFIIAEAGSNHNGNFKQALKLIDVAVESGADAVKFQTFKARRMYSIKAGQSDYLKMPQSIYQIIEDMEMPDDWIPQLATYCQSQGIMFLSTPFDEESVDLLDPYVPLFKIASYELTHSPLLEYIASKKKPMILSTGTANVKEIDRAVSIIKQKGNSNLILMQCTAKYPAPLETIHLKSILVMKEKFNLPVGLSDHSRDFDVAPMAAVALGADCIEKHFTLSNRLPGPDHQFALEPQELKWMVQKIRNVEKALGVKQKKMLQVEKELHAFARRSVFAINPILPGEILSLANTAILRNGKQSSGLRPDQYHQILGKKAKRTIEAGAPVRDQDIA